MMLSRVAGALYWLGRYLERAENVSRMLAVTTEISAELEGPDENVAQAEWDGLLRAVPGSEGVPLDFSPERKLAVPYLNAMLLDETNPVSVHHSLSRARENARAVREALTREVFSHLNEAFHELDDRRRRGIRDPAVGLDAVGRTHRNILTTIGAIEHTLSRDQGWTFMKIGEAVERTGRTLLILRAKLPDLRDGGDRVDIPLVNARWRALLRSVSSLENYRRVHGAHLDPTAVIHFLLFDRSTPRSVRCGVERIQNYLSQLPESEGRVGADRVVGRLLAKLRYEDEEIMRVTALDGFCDDTSTAITAIHRAVSQQYFPV